MVSVCSVPSVRLPRKGRSLPLGNLVDVGVEAGFVGGPQIVAPADDLFERVATRHGGNRIEHPPLAQNDALDRFVEFDFAAGDVGDGEALRCGGKRQGGGEGKGQTGQQMLKFHCCYSGKGC